MELGFHQTTQQPFSNFPCRRDVEVKCYWLSAVIYALQSNALMAEFSGDCENTILRIQLKFQIILKELQKLDNFKVTTETNKNLPQNHSAAEQVLLARPSRSLVSIKILAFLLLSDSRELLVLGRSVAIFHSVCVSVTELSGCFVSCDQSFKNEN